MATRLLATPAIGFSECHRMTKPTFAEFLDALRAGDPIASDEFARRYRPWLTILARSQLGRRLSGKADHSDVVQLALLEAVKGIPQFRGTTEMEFEAWLRKVLAHALSHEIRRFAGTASRDLDREVSLDQELEQSSMRLATVLAANDSSPSAVAARKEGALHLAAALARLNDDYRDVIVLRNIEGLSHEQVAERMNRNVGAVRMLWVRALARLRREMSDS